MSRGTRRPAQEWCDLIEAQRQSEQKHAGEVEAAFGRVSGGFGTDTVGRTAGYQSSGTGLAAHPLCSVIDHPAPTPASPGAQATPAQSCAAQRLPAEPVPA